VILARVEGTLERRNRLPISLAQKIASLECYRALTWLIPGDLAMASETMELTSRNYDHDSPELWDRHPEIMTMTARNYEIDIAKHDDETEKFAGSDLSL
jgi:hypothetical protein